MRIRTIVTLVAISVVAYACGDDNGTESDPLAELVGSYTADQWTYTPADTASLFPPIDLVGLGGAATVTLFADGTFSGTISLPTAPTTAIPFGGTVTIAGSTLTLTLSETLDLGVIVRTPAEPLVFDNFVLSGNILTLSSSDSQFGFALATGACGAPPCPLIPATLVIVLTR